MLGEGEGRWGAGLTGMYDWGKGGDTLWGGEGKRRLCMVEVGKEGGD